MYNKLAGLNRTFVELKQDFSKLRINYIAVLIEPLWN